ncbi:MAG: LLM class flavin-dependent oxidoreductase [Dehalococcoidia bacterium]
MKFGAHLPQIDFDRAGWTLGRLQEYADAARELGFDTLCINDHIAFPRPWLDGPTGLASVIERTGEMTLATTVAIPVVRGPAATAKTLAMIDVLSGGRLLVGVGPGSSALDYALVGIPFEERWKRLDESVHMMRALWRGETYKGRFYSNEGVSIEPRPEETPPIWIGSWGSEAGLRRTARLADGWLASGYNTTPEAFAEARGRLAGHLREHGKDPARFPNAIATVWMYITEDSAEARRVYRDVLAPMTGRAEQELRDRLLVGRAEECAWRLSAYQAAGAQAVFVWPVGDDVRQLELFMTEVVPRV